MRSVDIRPEAGELPSSFSERLGKSYAQQSSSKDKKTKGQFFTPVSIARFMGNLGHAQNGEISILDPGCGCAVLSAALIEHLVDSGNCQSIFLDVYETDTEVIPFTTAALDYMKSWLTERKITFSFTLYTDDFILSNSSCLEEEESLFGKQAERKYDFIISNPPYFKLAKDDKRVKSVGKLVDGQTNIYALFLSLSACMLNDGGQMIYITPRSFASGLYFQSFRNHFFSKVAIEFIHLFNSRKGTFAKDDVLQELLIMSCRPVHSENDGSITVSFSEGSSDLDRSYKKDFPQSDIVNVESNEKVVYLPVCPKDEKVLGLFKSWDGKLQEFKDTAGALKEKYAKEREMKKIPLVINGKEFLMSPGQHNEIQVKVIKEFAEMFVPGGVLLYVGDTEDKDLYRDDSALNELNLVITEHSKLPDIIICDKEKGWLFLIEVVTSHGPISPKRLIELEEFTQGCQYGKVYVTAFPDAKEFRQFAADIAWETEVWLADTPEHMIHFNGDRFIGPRQ